MRKVLAAAVILACCAVPAPAARSQELTASSIASLEEWIASVKGHVPGRADAPAASTARMSYAKRAELNPAMTEFLRVLRALLLQSPFATRDGPAKRAAQLAREVRQDPGPETFLERAAVLHADAAMLADRLGAFDDVTAPAPAGYDENQSPLLTNAIFVAAVDGQVSGEARANWNWPFARSLLDMLRPTALGDPIATYSPGGFVARWYHTTAAFMLARRLYAEASPHLQRATVLLPADPSIMFDRACYAEVFGLPMHQVLREHKVAGRGAGVPREADTNAEAEQWFLRAMQADPTFVEARTRLARLRDVAGQHELALADAERALSEHPEPTVAYYAHLFGGRAAQALGRMDRARQHYDAALELFTGAQSARLALSQLALLSGDLPATLGPVAALAREEVSLTSDPWWSYHLGAGRDVDALLADLWRRPY